MEVEKIKIMNATVIRSAESVSDTDVTHADYSHIQRNGIVYACVVAITPNDGVWFYLERKIFASLKHEVYARLNGVDYEDYLELEDYAEARYPEPEPEELKQFFLKYRQEFMPLRGIVDHTVPQAIPSANQVGNAHYVGDLIISSPVNG